MATPEDNGWLTEGCYQSRAECPPGRSAPERCPGARGRASVEQARVGLAQEGLDPVDLGLVPEATGGLAEHGQGTQESAVGGVGGGDRALAAPARSAQRVQAADRKSTRLNSSHVAISYAV